MYAEVYLEPSRTFLMELSLRKSQKSFTIDVRLDSKYYSGIGFTAEKVYGIIIYLI